MVGKLQLRGCVFTVSLTRVFLCAVQCVHARCLHTLTISLTAEGCPYQYLSCLVQPSTKHMVVALIVDRYLLTSALTTGQR